MNSFSHDQLTAMQQLLSKELESRHVIQAMHRDIRKRNNLGGSSGGRRKLTRKLRRY